MQKIIYLQFIIFFFSSCTFNPKVNKEGKAIIQLFQEKYECSISVINGTSTFSDSSDIWKYIQKDSDTKIEYPTILIETSDANKKINLTSQDSVNFITNELVNSLFSCLANKSEYAGVMAVYKIHRGNSFDNSGEIRMLYLKTESPSLFLYQITSW